jgi:hypothetical protein
VRRDVRWPSAVLAVSALALALVALAAFLVALRSQVRCVAVGSEQGSALTCWLVRE